MHSEKCLFVVINCMSAFICCNLNYLCNSLFACSVRKTLRTSGRSCLQWASWKVDVAEDWAGSLRCIQDLNSTYRDLLRSLFLHRLCCIHCRAYWEEVSSVKGFGRVTVNLIVFKIFASVQVWHIESKSSWHKYAQGPKRKSILEFHSWYVNFLHLFFLLYLPLAVSLYHIPFIEYLSNFLFGVAII